jgi:isopentenyl diphosphate isomerase/L-lactate dehydrogenase-like FMN-dependent dehydrogenase
MDKLSARREFLKFLAASPYVASLGGVTSFLRQNATAPSGRSDMIASPAEALNVFDFEEAAHRKVAQGHWAFMSSGVDDDATIAANREGFKHIELRPRRLRDASKVDMSVTLFGTTYSSPIFLCPTGGQKSFHPDGEAGVARAAKARGALQFLSTATATPIEEVNAAGAHPVWYQVYAMRTWEGNEKLLRRVEAAGSTVIALTVDTASGGHAESYMRNRPKDLSVCASCHDVKGDIITVRDRPMREGMDPPNAMPVPLDWALVDRMRKLWKGKFIIKGLVTREDARLAIEHGIDGILVSDHGGRVLDSLQPTIEALPEVVDEVRGRIPVFVDSGFRRGTDVFKGLALGATAVGIGRPMLWGLGAFGQAGVERVLEILQGELKLVMGNCGAHSVREITKDYVKVIGAKS